MFSYSDARTHIRGPPCSVRIAHKKAQCRSMSLMHRGICGREVWKMDSVITDVGWGDGGGLYSSLSFFIICFHDPLSHPTRIRIHRTVPLLHYH